MPARRKTRRVGRLRPSPTPYVAALLVGLGFLDAPRPARAEILPTAGDVARDTAPEQIFNVPSGHTTLPPVGEAEDLPPDGTPIPVQRIRVTGATLYPSATLEALVADFNGHTQMLAALTRAAERITRFYREHGWILARAHLPAQSIRQGQVEIRVIEGRLSGIQINVEPGVRLRLDVMGAHLAAIDRDAPLNQSQADRALLILSDLPGANLDASLTAGKNPGETELLVNAKPTPVLTGRLDMDNYGSLYTGRERLCGQLNLNSPLGYGERFSLQFLSSLDNLYYGKLATQIPLGGRGLTVGASLAHTQYALGDSFAQLNANGHVNVAELNLSYPLIRSVPYNLLGQISAENRNIFDEVSATNTATDKRAHHYSANLYFSGRDNLGGGGNMQATLRIGSGELDVRSPAALAIDTSGAMTAGHYNTLNVDFQRNQRLGEKLGLLMTLRGQLASRNLDSYQKFVLGGPNGVRAYPAGEAAGDQGWLASSELYYVVNAGFIPGVFFDAGGIDINRNAYLSTPNRRELHGYGLSVRGSQRTFDWSFSVSWRGSGYALAEPDRRMRAWARVGWAF